MVSRAESFVVGFLVGLVVGISFLLTLVVWFVLQSLSPPPEWFASFDAFLTAQMEASGSLFWVGFLLGLFVGFSISGKKASGD